MVQFTSYPQKSFPDKDPFKGTNRFRKHSLQLLYNKTLPSAARPFECKFGSPKPKHSLLTNEVQHKSQSPSKSLSSHQPNSH